MDTVEKEERMNADQIALTLLGLTNAYAAGKIEVTVYVTTVRNLQDWAVELGIGEEVQHSYRQAAWEANRKKAA
jgi:hypothetical protein